MEDRETPPIYTVGHSTRSLPALIGLLTPVGIRTLIDVRTIPRSRHNPQFNRETLSSSLPPHGIAYASAPALGGLRRPRRGSTNTGWRNESFRGYADHMETPPFDRALTELVAISRDGPTVVMCAEAVPWRCHRSLIADALLVRGVPVRHLGEGGVVTAHRLTPWAVVRGGRPTYPGATARSTLDEFSPPDPPAGGPVRDPGPAPMLGPTLAARGSVRATRRRP